MTCLWYPLNKTDFHKNCTKITWLFTIQLTADLVTCFEHICITNLCFPPQYLLRSTNLSIIYHYLLILIDILYMNNISIINVVIKDYIINL